MSPEFELNINVTNISSILYSKYSQLFVFFFSHCSTLYFNTIKKKLTWIKQTWNIWKLLSEVLSRVHNASQSSANNKSINTNLHIPNKRI